ncbi:MAG: AmmeMemoRadiSam system radical SAM enzyme [Candidatus Krumholzibacteriota bacterium]|nr:AmmeMemoRadiSam system radical SAM enzyme [Candidatus Krumholzibacteriota bacterium]
MKNTRHGRRTVGDPMTRRCFLAGSTAALLAAGIPSPAAADAVEARWWKPAGNGRVRCLLCPRACVIPPGDSGWCGARGNEAGRLVTLVWGRPCAMHLDPIEKKPFFHFLPGTSAFSLSTVGCNLACDFCQNWQISRSRPGEVDTQDMPPDRIVDAASRVGAASIAFTYGEPVVYWEYAADIASLARERGLRSVVVTGAYIETEPLRELCSLVDAVKIDLKAFDDDYYRRICSGRLSPVLSAIETVSETGTWLEIVYLVVPTLNDDPARIGEMAAWLAGHAGPDVPLHFSRFFPHYRLSDLPPTPVETLERARDAAMEAGMRYVYIGNVPHGEAENTCCPACGKTVVSRSGYRVVATAIREGRCAACGAAVPGVWE